MKNITKKFKEKRQKAIKKLFLDTLRIIPIKDNKGRTFYALLESCEYGNLHVNFLSPEFYQLNNNKSKYYCYDSYIQIKDDFTRWSRNSDKHSFPFKKKNSGLIKQYLSSETGVKQLKKIDKV
jgi:hypothetical protein